MQLDVEFSPEILGRALKCAREELRVSLRALAKTSGVSPSQILRIESGEFDCFVSSLVRLGASLGLRFPVLLEHSVLNLGPLYRSAFEKEQRILEQIGLPETSENRAALQDLVLGGCSIFSRLLRSGNPVAVAAEMDYPAADVKERFLKIASGIARHNYSPRTCVEFLSMLQVTPGQTLQRYFGFPSPSMIVQHAALFRSDRRGGYFPWIPTLAMLFSNWESVPVEFVAPDIDNMQQTADNPFVRLTWKELKRRLKNATVERGKKAAAADFAGVDRSNMNRWLDDDQQPGAEAAFRLLEWVTAEEAKQQSSQDAQTSREPKTQTERCQERETKQSEPGEPSPGSKKKSTPHKPR